MRKPILWFSTRSVTNRLYIRAVQPLKTDTSMKFCMYKEEGLHYPCSEIKGADHLRGYHQPLFSQMQIVGFLMWRLILFIIDMYVTL